MKDLKVLLPEDIGQRGILIEYDSGVINPQDERNLKILKEAHFDTSDELVLYAILQKSDTPNRNGRIYPERLLKRESEKYAKIIEKRSSQGELNHPESQRVTAQILTKNGWKFIKDIADDEEVYTMNESGQIELKRIYSKIIRPYKGKMIRIQGRNLDVCVTPNHDFPVMNQFGTKKFVKAQEILDCFQSEKNSLAKWYIPKTGKFSTGQEKDFIINGLSENEIPFRRTEGEKATLRNDLRIPIDVFMCFMGIYLAEGCIIQAKTQKRKVVSLENGDEVFYESSEYGYKIQITQKLPEKILLIEELLSLMPLLFKKVPRANGTYDFITYDARLHKYLKRLGKSHQKFIPEELKSQAPEHLEMLFKWFKLGDGRTIGKGKQSDVFSTSKRLVEDLQEILFKIGGSGNIRMEERNIDRYITDPDGSKRLIKGENTRPMWFLNISKTNGIWLDKRFLKVWEEDYDDFVYSVNVPNHIYYCKDQEKCHWTGNSSLLDLDRLSHTVTEIWWDDKMLMGKLKILTSPGWKKSGIISCKGDQAANLLMNGVMIGISSRGVGSLKREGGQNVVQDDFDLVCFDLVSSPSTPGAYLLFDLKDREKFDEGAEDNPKVQAEIGKQTSLMNKLNNFLKK